MKFNDDVLDTRRIKKVVWEFWFDSW